MPFVIVAVLAGFRQVDPTLETAARVMGASRVMTLTRITLPLIRPSVIAAGLFAFLISFDEVVVAYFLTGVRTQTLPVKMYSSIRWEISPVLAAIASLLTVASCVICLATALLQRKEVKNV
jgi:putative spermidine/putrescine transport system permease protein